MMPGAYDVVYDRADGESDTAVVIVEPAEDTHFKRVYEASKQNIKNNLLACTRDPRDSDFELEEDDEYDEDFLKEEDEEEDDYYEDDDWYDDDGNGLFDDEEDDEEDDGDPIEI